MDMQDYELSILEQYHISVKSTRKTRGAFFCDTDKGLLLLKEAGASEKRIPALYELCEHLKAQGYTRVDQLVQNKEGAYISTSEDGTKYILKYWFKGRECDIRKSGELLDAAKNLAHLHGIMTLKTKEHIPQGVHLKEEYMSHNRELKKVRKFMRTQSPKGDFEMAFLKCFDYIYQWADAAMGELTCSDYEKLYEESVSSGRLIHGDYNYHNILSTPEGLATTNFDKFKKDIQTEDFYYFLRKAMEKHGWNKKLGDHMLNAYSAIRPFTSREWQFLKLRLIYPEKFWKIADSYYRSNKAWISVKNLEKLKTAIMQTEEKRRFLEDIFSFHLQNPVV